MALSTGSSRTTKPLNQLSFFYIYIDNLNLHTLHVMRFGHACLQEPVIILFYAWHHGRLAWRH